MDVTLPDLGENIEEAEVLKVLVREGDAVARDQPVLELETDKATFELPCPEAGTVTAIHVKKGDTLRIGQRIVTVEARAPAATGRGGRAPAKGAPEPAEARAERRPAEQGRPRPADEDGGEAQETGEPRRTEPAQETTEARKAGEPRGTGAPRRTEARRTGEARGTGEPPRTGEAAGARVAEAGPVPTREREAKPPERGEGPHHDDAGEAPAARPAAPSAAPAEKGDAAEAEPSPTPARPGRTESRPASPRAGEERPSAPARDEDGGAEAVAAGPTARRLAREHDVDLRRIQGTGSGGRITPDDVQAFVRDHASAGRASAAPTAEKDEATGSVERQPLSGIDKATARHLAASWSEIPHVTHHDLADVTELEQARARHASRQADSGPKLTWTVLVVKAVVAALKTFPRFNATLDAEREELVVNRAVHVGIAVDTEHGLLVPVLHDAQGKSTRQIAAAIAALADRARARKLARDEMRGAGFTVTNLGGIGGVAFTPIVSRPEVAILGVARLHERLALRDGQPVPRIMLPLSLSYDHRVINGADAARFVRHVAALLEDPVALLLES